VATRSKLTALSVSVVIPHQGSDTALESCLEALRRQTFPRARTEVLLVLNEKTPRDLHISLHHGERVLWQPEHFSYAARNLGVTHAAGDIIAFTDSDTIPDVDWLRHGVDAISAGADLLAGQINLTFSSERLTPAACYEKLFAFDQEKNVSSSYSTTANLFARASLFDEVGLFDQRALTGADFEWTKKAVAAGARLIYAPNAVVSHPARESMAELFTKAKRTSSLFAGASLATDERPSVLRDRLRHQLAVAPSHSKQSAVKPLESLLAHSVRMILVAYKALQLLRGQVKSPTPVPPNKQLASAESIIVEASAV